MTFEQVKEKSWEVSKVPLEFWKPAIENCLENHSKGFNKAFYDISKLYNKEKPESIKVSLQYYPTKEQQKGEPITNFVEKGRLKENFADILYWVAEVEDDKDYIDCYAFTVVVSIIHEAQHRFFQDKEFSVFLKEIEQDTRAKKVMGKLKKISGNYIEITFEAITCYLESYARDILESYGEGNEKTNVVLEIDQEKIGIVTELVIKSDIEEWKNKGVYPGPYTQLRKLWEIKLGGLPTGFESTDDDKPNIGLKGRRQYMGTSIYEIARGLDLNLVKNYVEEGKKIDKEFVLKMLEMMEKKI